VADLGTVVGVGVEVDRRLAVPAPAPRPLRHDRVVGEGAEERAAHDALDVEWAEIEHDEIVRPSNQLHK
jgi:hypothetical protein